MRVSPELVEARPGQAERNRWGQQFDASLTNVFEVQADIATKVAGALGVELADSVRAGLEARPTTNLEAYDVFLKGEAATANMTLQDAPSISRALPYYRRTVELDFELCAGLGPIVPSVLDPVRERGPDCRAGVERRRGH